MNRSSTLVNLPFGLLELDEKGTVIRYSPEADRHPGVPARNVLGRDFFNDVVPVERVRECQGRFHDFMAGSEPTWSFTFSIRLERGAAQVQFLLARIDGRLAHGRNPLALVRIRPET